MAKSKAKANARKGKQRVAKRYSKAREDAQLAGVIDTTPAGAVRVEAVPPSAQGEQALPALDRQAIRQGWAVPEEIKRKVIDRLAEPFFEEQRVVLDRDGNRVVLPPDRNLLKENAKVLVQADREQWERDNPTEAGKTKGSVNVTTTAVAAVDLDELLRRVAAERQGGGLLRRIEELPNALHELPTEAMTPPDTTESVTIESQPEPISEDEDE